MLAYYDLKSTLPESELENCPDATLPEVLSSPVSEARPTIDNNDTITAENHSAMFYVNQEIDA
ncbi:unnamed protein product [Dibothriocephalus latus]|uniref:Uncharacterized protein n=1 Tax=Dibothriocephalus latus TaxID=60516 RepID=A0A3P7LYB8_DIBLA|nr:unnamed protein product [Dibothriocephalus latus]